MLGEKQNIRIKYIFLVCLLIFFLVLFKVFYIQVIKYNKLNKLANELWSRNLNIASDRGKILDRNGKVIVDNETTVGLFLVPSQIPNKDEVSKSLSEILNVSKEKMDTYVNKKASIVRVHPEGRNLNYNISNKINKLNYEGVYLLKESKRYYKYGSLLSHIVGYTGIDNQGLSGLEYKYDKLLKGKEGNIKYYSDGKGKRMDIEEVYSSPTKGKDIYLTIDLDIQLSLENELSNAFKKYKADGAMGIVMDSSNGQVLAMSSFPSFNPSKYQKYSKEVINRNLPIWQNFEPGSTFKIITLSSAINEGLVNIFEDKYNDSGVIKVANAKIHCWKRKGHGMQTYLQVVENSCNPGFVVLGQKLGKERLFKYIKDFGFGKKTGIDLNGEASGILFDLDKVGPVELATTSFGQGISVTAIGQVSALSSILNNGKLYKPYIVSKIGNKTFNPTIKKENIIKKETSDLVRYALLSVVANGSGRNAYIENYKVGGKTGTAQKVGENSAYMYGNYILSFIGFLSDKDKDYVIYIGLDNPKGVTQYGGVASAPIAKNVLKDIISIYNIKESKEVLPMQYRWNDQLYITIPKLIGKTKKEVKSLLKDVKIEFIGDGKVIDTNPKEGSRIKSNSTIKILLN